MGAEATKQNPPLIELTNTARDKVKSLLAREGKAETAFLRVAVVGGGCSGFSYKMSFEDQPKDNDQTFVSNGIPVVVDKKSSLFITGLRLNFEDGLNGAGFTYENPKASKSCGCGTSFSV